MLRWFNFRVARVLPFVDFTASLHSPWSMGRRLAAVHTMIFPEIKQRPWQAALDQVGALSLCRAHMAGHWRQFVFTKTDNLVGPMCFKKMWKLYSEYPYLYMCA
jgi:hypothetical protein